MSRIWSPTGSIHLESHLSKYKGRYIHLDNQRREYYDLHSVCPECKGEDIEQTCVGYAGKDHNAATCYCGWSGIVVEATAGEVGDS